MSRVSFVFVVAVLICMLKRVTHMSISRQTQRPVSVRCVALRLPEQGETLPHEEQLLQVM
jgi:hypothetical protein